jgi:hypothetical protein
MVPVPYGLIPPPSAAGVTTAAAAAETATAAGADDGNDPRDGGDQGADPEGAEEEDEDQAEENEAAAATAPGPCLVLCSRRGLIKRVLLRNLRRERRNGITVRACAQPPSCSSLLTAPPKRQSAVLSVVGFGFGLVSE